jgi:hypothetical protein
LIFIMASSQLTTKKCVFLSLSRWIAKHPFN